MAPGVPLNALSMSAVRTAESGLSVLSLRFEVAHGDPDWPVVSIDVDGDDPFREVADQWLGFDPAEVLGDDSPLVPTDFGQRVAVKRCSCGEAGCGVIAPLVVASPDGKRISWLDFRDFTGVFIGPTHDGTSEHEGRPWNVPEIHFDRAQYIGEVDRARADRSWESPRRRVARLVHERLADLSVAIPPNLELRWVSPTWRTDGFSICLAFAHVVREPEYSVDHQVLELSSSADDPESAAAEIVERLLGELPDDWTRLFGYDPRRGRR
jgi:hypothetical protein